MDEGDPRAARELTELRLRLYRPDPPDGAVGAYLAAVAAFGTARGPAPAGLGPVTHPRRRPRERLRPRLPARSAVRALGVVAAALAAAVLLPLALHQVAVATAAAPVAQQPIESVPVPAAPGVPLGTMAGGPAQTRRFVAGGAPVVVSVLCAGSGIMTVRIGSEPATVLTCDTEVAALALMQSVGDLDRFAVTVAPDRTVRWTLSVGALRPTASPAAPAASPGTSGVPARATE